MAEVKWTPQATDDLEAIAEFIASVSPDIPWHVTAYHDDYKMTNAGATRPSTLIRAAEAGTRAGLRFVYAGNASGRVGSWEDTRCPSCATILIERSGYTVRKQRILNGACPDCGTIIPGRWD